jgi:aspartyl-tRNA(Asn)/glutamyl-tRNA(Gln) amidotransferase subunit C
MELQDLRETAELAHLNMETGELQAAFGAFEEMLSFFAAMQAADQDTEAFSGGVKNPASGMAASSRLVNAGHFRTDGPNPGNSANSALNEALLDKAGDRDGRFVVIPNVL